MVEDERGEDECEEGGMVGEGFTDVRDESAPARLLSTR